MLAKAVAKKFNDEFVEPLETQAKQELLEDYKTNGTDRRTTPNLGDGMGKLYVKAGKTIPSEEKKRFVVYDKQALDDWMDAERPDTDCFVSENIEQFAEWYAYNSGTGEVPDGCRVEEYTAEGYTTAPTAVLTPNYAKIYEAFAPQLDGVARLMLEGGYDG